MTLAIMATGDELVHGDILNTNGRDIARSLSSEGISLGIQLTCSDKEMEMIDCLRFLAEKHDIIIIIGGLGPTTDDLTRFAVAQFTGDTLVQHSTALEHIQSRLHNANVAMSQGNLQQSLFPKNAKLLPNPFGSALGCTYQWNQKLFFLLPGPPRECLPMFHQYVLPALQKTTHSQKQILKWQIFGLPESEIAQKLEDALRDINCQTGYRWESPYIEFKIRCHPNLVDTIKGIIDPLLEPHIISDAGKKASDNLRELITTLNEPITFIDEATGGLLQVLLTRPKLHHLLDFNNLHQNKLYFHIRGLEEYWCQQTPQATTQLIIDYSNQCEQGRETHDLQWHGLSVVEYATEWLCFRLIHLINQLHQ